MVGPGWGPANAWPVNGIFHGPICLPIPIDTVYGDSAIRRFFCDLHRGAIRLCTSLMTSKRPIGSLLSLGVPGLTKFNGCLPFLGSSWHVTAVSQCAMLLLIRELVTSGSMTNEGWEFSAASFGKNSIPDRSSAPLWYASPQHLQFTIKHNQPGRNPGQGFALKCGHFDVGVFGICFQTIQFCHIPSDRQVGKWLGHWMPISIQISTCKTLYFSLWLWVYCWKGE